MDLIQSYRTYRRRVYFSQFRSYEISYRQNNEKHLRSVCHACLPCLLCSTENEEVFHPCIAKQMNMEVSNDMHISHFLCRCFHTDYCQYESYPVPYIKNSILFNEKALLVYALWHIWRTDFNCSWLYYLPEECLADIIDFIPNIFLPYQNVYNAMYDNGYYGINSL